MIIHIIAVGRLKDSWAQLADMYAMRINPRPQIREITGQSSADEAKKISAAIPKKSLIIACDERGEDITSRAFAEMMANWENNSVREITFLIGGADGLSRDLIDISSFRLSLGRKTWPHKLARIMLLEQLYRAQQLRVGHPYHRD